MDYIDPALLRSLYPAGSFSFLDKPNEKVDPEEEFFRIFVREVTKNSWEEEDSNSIFDNNFYQAYTNDIFSDIIAKQMAENF